MENNLSHVLEDIGAEECVADVLTTKHQHFQTRTLGK